MAQQPSRERDTLVVLRLALEPLADTVLPPITSKVVKYIVLEAGAPSLRSPLEARHQGARPASISMLYRGARPLYQRWSRGSAAKPLTAKKGEPLEARIALLADSLDPALEASSIEGVHETPYGRYRVTLLSAEAKHLAHLCTEPPQPVLAIRAKTPVIIAAKLLQPSPRHRAAPGHRLLPTPGTVVAQLVKQWNTLAPESLRIPGSHASHGLRAELAMTELDYRLEPETVLIGKTAAGTPRLARGWRGWILYRVWSRRLAETIAKPAALANALGLGRSRGIGLGDVEIQWRPLRSHSEDKEPQEEARTQSPR